MTIDELIRRLNTVRAQLADDSIKVRVSINDGYAYEEVERITVIDRDTPKDRDENFTDHRGNKVPLPFILIEDD